MGGGGSKTQTTEVKLPAWVENASLQNYQFAQQVAAQPYQAYTGQTVAGFSPDQMAAMDYARNNVGAYQGAYDAGLGYANEAAAYQPDQVAAPFLNYGYSPDQIQQAQVNYGYTPEQVQAAMINYGYQPQQVNYGYQPDRVSGKQFSDADVSGYMNPYLNEVEANAIRNLQGATQLAVNKIGDQAAAAKAYGGSRQGISEGVAIAEGTKQAGELSAKLRADAYDKALQQITADQNRALQADMANQQTGLTASRYGLDAQLANQQAGLTASRYGLDSALANQNAMMNAQQLNQQAGLTASRYGLDAALANQQNAYQTQAQNQQANLTNARYGLDANLANQQAIMQAQLANQTAGLNNAQRQLQAALGMGTLADQGRNAQSQDVARMLGIGAMQQDQEQKYLDDAYARFTEARDYPKDQLNILLASLGMSPYGRTQTTTSSGGGSDVGGILGGAGTALAGIAKIAPLFMSDEKEKTDVKKVGTDKETGLDVYSYRYKGDPKTYPKIVGLMADDIEEEMPEAVANVGGKKAVKFDTSVPKARISAKKA